jgi:hypothetical protein
MLGRMIRGAMAAQKVSLGVPKSVPSESVLVVAE